MINKGKTKVKTLRHIPLDIKITDVESGAMCASMLFKYYRLFLNRDQANEVAGTSINGTTLERIAEGFINKGFDTQIQENITDFQNVLLPAIVLLNNGKYRLIHKVSSKYVYFNDPESGKQKLDGAAFMKEFSGRLLEVYPNEKFKIIGKEKKLIDFIKEMMGNDIRLVFLAVILGIILLFPAIIFPASYKIFLDNILGLKQEYLFRPMILFLSLLMVFTGIVTFVQWKLITRIEIKHALLHSSNFFRRLLRLPLPFFMSRYPGELSKRIPLLSDVAMVFSIEFPKTLINVISIILYALVMLNYNVILTIIGVTFSIINLLALKFISTKRETLNQTIVQNQGKVYSESMVGLKMIETIKSTASENDFFAHWAGYQTRFINNYQKLGFINRFLDVLPEFLKNLNNIILISMGALLVIYNSMTVGFLVAFQALMDTFTKPVSQLLNNGSRFQDAASAITTLRDAFDVEEDEAFTKEINKKPLNVSPQTAKLEGYLDIVNLKFGYDKFAEPFIKDFNLSIKPGQCVALVGGSGSGKSTIAKLVIGIHKAWAGKVLFDGKPAVEYPNVIMTNSLSMVDQDIFLFSGTVSENISMWNKQVPKNRIKEAAHDACIDEVIEERPNGYESKVLESGKNYSGGQQQRLEIARALVTKPSILILDEATSALDPDTELKLMSNLRKRGASMLVIAHRLSTIRDCDKILVLENGNIVQEGIHDELIKQQDKLYYKLIKSS